MTDILSKRLQSKQMSIKTVFWILEHTNYPKRLVEIVLKRQDLSNQQHELLKSFLSDNDQDQNLVLKEQV